MKQIAAAAAVLTAFFALVACRSDASDSAATVTITGKVTSDDPPHDPIIGVKVVAYRDGNPVAKDTTDANGAYTLAGIPSGGKLTLKFSHSAWTMVVENNVPGDENGSINKRLEPISEASKVTGTVTKVGDNSITVTDKDGKDHALTVAKDTKIRVDGQDSKLADLDPTKVTTVTVTLNADDKTTAAAIDAKTK